MKDRTSSIEGQLRAQRAALADFGLYAFLCDDLDDLLRRAAELVSNAMDVDLVKILEHRPERKELLIRCGVNWQPGVVGHVTFADHEHSPGGYALQSGEPVVSPDVDRETRFEIPEVLVRHDVRSMVNVIIAGSARPFGVLEVDARDKRTFGADDVDFLRNYANLLAAAIDRLRLHRSLEENAREQQILAHELRHRVKNLLGLVQALISQTSTEDRTAEEFGAAVSGRIRALAAAEEVVFDAQEDDADIRRLAELALAPFRRDRPEALRIDGARLKLPARGARMLGLALHELATNSAKHGALAAPSGYVDLRWHSEAQEDATRIEVVWSEQDGPQIAAPEGSGFGTRLLKEILPREVHGTSELLYHRSGFEFRLNFPLNDPDHDPP